MSNSFQNGVTPVLSVDCRSMLYLFYDLSTSRRRSSSRAPNTSAVHREADEHWSLGRVSWVSAKNGLMSDLLYDTVQEAALEQQEEDEPRQVCRTVLITTMDVVT